MKPEDAKQLEQLLARLCEADRQARIANAVRANAHIAVVTWVGARVPVGTLDAVTLEIPAFLRANIDAPLGDLILAEHPAGCGCDDCAVRRMHARLQEA